MAAVLLYVVVTLFVGGLGLIAQQVRKSRGAEVTLLVVLLALSLLVALLGVATSIGLFFVASGQSVGGVSGGVSARVLLASAGIAALLVGVAGLGLCVPPLRKVLGRTLNNPWWADPPIFLALWLFAVVLANNVVSLLIFTLVPNVGALFPSGRISPGAILTSQLPFLAVALLGVGIILRRSVGETLARLGYGPISVKQLGIVALFIPAAIGLSIGADALFSVLQPDLYEKVGNLSNNLFSPQGLSPPLGDSVRFPDRGWRGTRRRDLVPGRGAADSRHYANVDTLRLDARPVRTVSVARLHLRARRRPGPIETLHQHHREFHSPRRLQLAHGAPGLLLRRVS